MALLSVMVAAAIGTVVVLGIVTFLSHLQEGQNAVKFRVDADVVTEEMRALLSSEPACINSLGGLVAVTGASLPVANLRDGSASPGAIVYSTNSIYGDWSLFLTSMTLTDYVAGVSPSQATMVLRSQWAPGPWAQIHAYSNII